MPCASLDIRSSPGKCRNRDGGEQRFLWGQEAGCLCDSGAMGSGPVIKRWSGRGQCVDRPLRSDCWTSCHTPTGSSPVNSPHPPLFLEKRALCSPSRPGPCPEGGWEGFCAFDEEQLLGIYRKRASWEPGDLGCSLKKKKKRMKQRNRWSIISDSFLLTGAISYKITHSMADRTRGVIWPSLQELYCELTDPLAVGFFLFWTEGDELAHQGSQTPSPLSSPLRQHLKSVWSLWTDFSIPIDSKFLKTRTVPCWVHDAEWMMTY